MTKYNLGRFFLNRIYVEDKPDEVARILFLMQCVPVRVEVLFDGEIEYLALSPLFEEITHGTIAPTYVITISMDAGKISKVSADKI